MTYVSHHMFLLPADGGGTVIYTGFKPPAVLGPFCGLSYFLHLHGFPLHAPVSPHSPKTCVFE